MTGGKPQTDRMEWNLVACELLAQRVSIKLSVAVAVIMTVSCMVRNVFACGFLFIIVRTFVEHCTAH